MLQMDKVLTTAQQDSFKQGTLTLKVHDLKGYGSFKCSAAARKIADVFEFSHRIDLITWPQITNAKSTYLCPNGHGREATSPTFIFHAPPAMVWCPSCKRPHGYTRWTCECNRPWHNGVKHKPTSCRTIVVRQCLPQCLVPERSLPLRLKPSSTSWSRTTLVDSFLVQA